MVEELERYTAGERLRWGLTPEAARHSIHRPLAEAKTTEPKKWRSTAFAPAI
jgi:hypothetical protein